MIINFIPSVGDNQFMFQAYTSYFGGAIGGLATLITIYFTIIKTREEHRPLLYFNNTSTFYYRNKSGVYNVFNRKEISRDEEVKQENEGFSFQLDNVGIYPALDLKLTIINLKDFLETAKLLKIDDEMYKKLNNSYSKDDKDYLTISLLKQGESVKVFPSLWFESFLTRLIYYYNNNNDKGVPQNNNYAVHGRFKLFDIRANYKDIDGNLYNDYFKLYVRLESTVQLVTDLKKYEPWHIIVEFEKYTPA
jgi:ABC-type antimicrobial peptide transport system permease subunit